MRHIYTLLRW